MFNIHVQCRAAEEASNHEVLSSFYHRGCFLYYSGEFEDFAMKSVYSNYGIKSAFTIGKLKFVWCLLNLYLVTWSCASQIYASELMICSWLQSLKSLALACLIRAACILQIRFLIVAVHFQSFLIQSCCRCDWRWSNINVTWLLNNKFNRKTPSN